MLPIAGNSVGNELDEMRERFLSASSKELTDVAAALTKAAVIVFAEPV